MGPERGGVVIILLVVVGSVLCTERPCRRPRKVAAVIPLVVIILLIVVPVLTSQVAQNQGRCNRGRFSRWRHCIHHRNCPRALAAGAASFADARTVVPLSVLK